MSRLQLASILTGDIEKKADFRCDKEEQIYALLKHAVTFSRSKSQDTLRNLILNLKFISFKSYG